MMKRERLQAVLAVSFVAKLAVGLYLRNYEVSLESPNWLPLGASPGTISPQDACKRWPGVDIPGVPCK